jgi:ubiquinone/menaquinone biosynthesis C-methylase UbiE
MNQQNNDNIPTQNSTPYTSHKDTHSNNPSYMLYVGEKTVTRLDLLNKIYGPKTFQLLQDLLDPSHHVLSLGCGTGNIECCIAKTLSQQGKILATDISEEQLMVAQKKALKENLKNISFLQKDINDLNYSNEFDMAYCRFLLIHLKEPEKALNNMIKAVRPGGLVVLEDINYSGVYVYPPNESVQKGIDLIARLAQWKGIDFDLGPKLHHMLFKLGVRDIKIQAYQPVGGREEKVLLEMTIREAKEQFIKEKLVTPEELDQILKGIEEVVQDPSISIGVAPSFLVWGTIQ